MKTITIDDKKIEISDESYEAFKRQFVTEDKAILWKPEDNDDYWSVNTDGEVENFTWYSDSSNDEQQEHDFELGNIYKTKEEAQESLDTGWIAKRKAEVKILRFIAENDLEWDRGTVELNCDIYYDHELESFGWDKTHEFQYSILPSFKSGLHAQKVIDAMTPELKILFGVK